MRTYFSNGKKTAHANINYTPRFLSAFTESRYPHPLVEDWMCLQSLWRW